MISNQKNALSPILKFTKYLHDFMIPVLSVVVVICLILCCFEPAEGTNNDVVNLIVLVIALLGIAALKIVNNRLRETNRDYKIYQSFVSRKMDWSNSLPLLLMTVVIGIPFYMLLLTSVKTPLEANSIEFTWWPKEGFDFESYKEIFSYSVVLGVSMLRAAWNSFIYAIIPTLIGVMVSALSAYAFSKLKFKGRNTLYHLLIMTMMMPGCVTMTTSYLMYAWYGWTDSAMPLIIPGFFGGAATVMFMREYFMGIPDGMLEAARIDGAGKWTSFLLIVIPLGKPAILAQFILNFISKYNDFLGPLIYLNDPEKYTLQVALDFISWSSLDKSLIASACVFALVPMLLVYVFFQKKILSGIAMSSGLKG
ncbi:MAG: carbohydrate ABC transporter permease [Ruminococcaceae bacterium]|nr:carbohydrate ABC transporter permease [Oscillospiraceae bacterium]